MNKGKKKKERKRQIEKDIFFYRLVKYSKRMKERKKERQKEKKNCNEKGNIYKWINAIQKISTIK